MLRSPVGRHGRDRTFKTFNTAFDGKNVWFPDTVLARADLLLSYPTPDLLQLAFCFKERSVPSILPRRRPSIKSVLFRSYRACPVLVHSMRRLDELWDSGDFT